MIDSAYPHELCIQQILMKRLFLIFFILILNSALGLASPNLPVEPVRHLPKLTRVEDDLSAILKAGHLDSQLVSLKRVNSSGVENTVEII